MGYTNRIISRYSLEEDFHKTVANFLNNASNKIVWNEDAATISSQMIAATGNFPDLSFNILQDFLLRYRVPSDTSAARKQVSFIIQHEDFNTAFIDSLQSLSTASTLSLDDLTDRTLRFKIATNNNCIFISVNNNLNIFFIKTNNFIGASVATSETSSPLTSNFGLKIKKQEKVNGKLILKLTVYSIYIIKMILKNQKLLEIKRFQNQTTPHKKELLLIIYLIALILIALGALLI